MKISKENLRYLLRHLPNYGYVIKGEHPLNYDVETNKELAEWLYPNIEEGLKKHYNMDKDEFVGIIIEYVKYAKKMGDENMDGETLEELYVDKFCEYIKDWSNEVDLGSIT